MEIVTTSALHIYPEIWEIIFEFVGFQNDKTSNLASNDLYSCYDACTYFGNILLPIRSTFLFHEILPFLVYRLDGKSLLACRRVCKTWKIAVDYLLEYEKNYLDALFDRGLLIPVPVYPNHLNNDTCRMWRRTRAWKSAISQCTISIHSGTQISRFCHNFSAHWENPFPGKTLHIGKPPDVENYENYYKVDLTELLIRFGDHVQNLSLEMDRRRCRWSELISILSACLRLTPNLKRLQILGLYVMFQGLENIQVPTVDSIDFPPELPNLISIEFPGECFIPEVGVSPSVLEEFLVQRYAPQLQHVQLFFGSEVSRPGKIPLRKLRELKVKVASAEHFSSHFASVCYGGPTELVNSGLRTVIIELKNGDYQLGDILQNLQMFKTTMSALFILFPFGRWNFREDVLETEVEILKELHNLKYLHIEGFKFGEVNIANCLPCKLKYLVLEDKDMRGEFALMVSGSNHWTKVLGPGVSADLSDLRDIYNSPLWERLPRLRSLSVTYSATPIRRYVYRRENKEKWMERKRRLGILDLDFPRVRSRIRDFVRRVRQVRNSYWKEVDGVPDGVLLSMVRRLEDKLISM